MRRRTALALCGGWPLLLQAREALTVFAAASLKDALDAVAAACMAQQGWPLRVSYAASSALARQIAQGAPADIYFSADSQWMDWLAARALIEPTSRVDLLGNALVLVAPVGSAFPEVRLDAEVDLLKLLGANGRLAVAETRNVPAGRYARAALERLRLWPALRSRLAEADNVRHALAFVARGEAPLGIVYLSDAAAEPAVRILARFDSSSHPPIRYPVARLARSSHPVAGPLLDWLQQETAMALFLAHGFSRP